MKVLLLILAICSGFECVDADTDDVLTLDISEPIITRGEYGVRYVWYVQCCDNHGKCDEAHLVTSRYLNGDLNGDDVVNMHDLAIMADNWLMEIK